MNPFVVSTVLKRKIIIKLQFTRRRRKTVRRNIYPVLLVDGKLIGISLVNNRLNSLDRLSGLQREIRSAGSGRKDVEQDNNKK